MNVNVIVQNEPIKVYKGGLRSDYVFEYLNSNNYSFVSSNIYGLIGHYGSGNWALSQIIAGRTKKHKTQIYVDGNNVSYKDLRNMCCYIGYEHNIGYLSFARNHTLKATIEQGIIKTNNNIDTVESIAEEFELSYDRIDRKFKFLGNEHWRASLAIGQAWQKRIYCAPFLDGKNWGSYYSIQLEKWLKLLKQKNSIVILPVSDEECIKSIADKLYYF